MCRIPLVCIYPETSPVRQLTIFTLLLLLLACDRDRGATIETAAAADYAPESSIELEPPRTAQPPPPPTPDPAPTSPRIIYTATVVARVNRLDSALAAVNAMVGRTGGYVSDQQRTNQRYRKDAHLTIRLPADRLQPLLADLPALARQIDEETLRSDDVSAEWIDLESRLATKREVRDRYIDILRNKAVKVEDILAAEDKIRVITEEIEAKEGRLRYLRDQVSLSTLNLTLYEEQAYRPEARTYGPSFLSELGEALGMGGRMVRTFLLFVVAVWPLWVLLGLGWWLWRRRS